MARKRFWAALCLLSATVAHAQSEPSEESRRAELLPTIRGATQCIAREVLKQPGVAEAAEAGRLAGLLARPIKACEAQVRSMISEHDRIYGPLTGQSFFDGPYTTDLPRAVLGRIKGELQRRASASAAREAPPRTREPAQPPARLPTDHGSESARSGGVSPSDGTRQPAASAPSPPWQETVAAEHARRRERLRDLTERRLRASPEFYEALITKAELPEEFGADVPVLRVVFPQRVFFDTDIDVVRPDAQRVIDVVADVLRSEHAHTAVFIAGHTDARGGDDYNFNLSVRRAESVARALERKGIPDTQFWRVGFGKAIPLAANTSDENMARNRRVEFLFARHAEALRTWLADRQGSVICSDSPDSTRAECQRSVAKSTTVEATAVGPAGMDKATIPITVVHREPVPLERGERNPVDLRDPPLEVGRPEK